MLHCVSSTRLLPSFMVGAVQSDCSTAVLSDLQCDPAEIKPLRYPIGEDLAAAVDSSLAEMRKAFARPDLGEAVMAKLEKRPPQFPASP